MAYNIKKALEKYEVMTGQKKASSQQKKGPPFPQWKPALTEDGKPRTFNVRFLPYQDQNEQPFQEVNYYDNKKLSAFRLVAPAQFGLPDPVAELVAELRSQRNNKNAWNVIKGLLPRPRYFAPVLVREEADKGVQIWELSPSVCKEIYAILVSEDFRDTDVTDPQTGYDFQVSVTSSGKIFKAPNGNEYPVNDVKLQARMKPSKLATKPEQVDALIKSIPDLQGIFKGQVQPADKLGELLEAYLSTDAQGDTAPASVTGTPGGAVEAPEADDSAAKSIEDQFAGL